jgi:hypothetical protein
MGVVMEDKRIVIGDECRTLFVRQIDEERTQICLVDGNRVRTNRVMMQFEHMKHHGVGYK